MKRIDEYRCTAFADGRFTVEHLIGDRMAYDRKVIADRYITPMTGSGDTRTLQQGAADQARNFVKRYKRERKQREALHDAATTFTIKA